MPDEDEKEKSQGKSQIQHVTLSATGEESLPLDVTVPPGHITVELDPLKDHPGLVVTTSEDSDVGPLPDFDPARAKAAMEEVLAYWEKQPLALRKRGPAIMEVLSQLPGFAREDRGELLRELAHSKAEIARRMALAPDDSHVVYSDEVDPEYAAREKVREEDFQQTFGIPFDRALHETFGHTPEEIGTRVPTVYRMVDPPITPAEQANPKPPIVAIHHGSIPYVGKFKPEPPPVRVASDHEPLREGSVKEETEQLVEVTSQEPMHVVKG
jgi:hypothetical protein